MAIVDLILKFNSHLVSTRRQERYLSVVRKLWSTAEGALPLESASSVASALLKNTLSAPFQISSEPQVKEEWVGLCTDLVAAIESKVLLGVCESHEAHFVFRLMWAIIGRRWSSFAKDAYQWESLVDLLTRPIGYVFIVHV